MKPADRFYEKRSFWLTGGAGFVFAALLSLAGGNLLLTSLQRGFAGMIAAMVLFWLFHKFYQSIKQVVEPSNSGANQGNAAGETNTTGTKFDVSLPAESPLDEPLPSDFAPWVIGQSPSVNDQQAKQMAETLREMQK